MNTTDVIKAVSEEVGFSQVDTKKVVQSLFTTLSETMKEEDI
jgi:nucleoid DNA-binding protein